MSADPSFTPKYVESIDEVPVTGPDPYTQVHKQRSIKRGEARLEADINDGDEIKNPEQIHADAANYFASYLLHLGPRDPSSVTMGDSSDEGPGRLDFADRMYELYTSTIESITGAEGDEGEGPADAGEPGSGPPKLVSFGSPPSNDHTSNWNR